VSIGKYSPPHPAAWVLFPKPKGRQPVRHNAISTHSIALQDLTKNKGNGANNAMGNEYLLTLEL
jgi:hypothetical protein